MSIIVGRCGVCKVECVGKYCSAHKTQGRNIEKAAFHAQQREAVLLLAPPPARRPQNLAQAAAMGTALLPKSRKAA